ncbi:MAG TPA: hypothetical protein VHT03_01660 [Rhizomicrobium sp.]|jgi:hypothetical protein|nr:hypothetical protein [Rhizomicrobium sp.]
MLDAKKVDSTIKGTAALTAVATALAIEAGATTPAQVQAAAAAGPEALAQVIPPPGQLARFALATGRF